MIRDDTRFKILRSRGTGAGTKIGKIIVEKTDMINVIIGGKRSGC